MRCWHIHVQHCSQSAGLGTICGIRDCHEKEDESFSYILFSGDSEAHCEGVDNETPKSSGNCNACVVSGSHTGFIVCLLGQHHQNRVAELLSYQGNSVRIWPATWEPWSWQRSTVVSTDTTKQKPLMKSTSCKRQLLFINSIHSSCFVSQLLWSEGPQILMACSISRLGVSLYSHPNDTTRVCDRL